MNQIQQLDAYFASLSRTAKSSISAGRLSAAIQIDSTLALKVLSKEVEEGFLKRSYAIRCPSCGTIIKRIDTPNQIPSDPCNCYACDDEVEITADDVEVLYELPTDISPFPEGQHEKMQVEEKKTERVAQLDRLAYNVENGIININEAIYHPTGEQYVKMNELFDSLSIRASNTTEAGKTLENLIIFLFNVCNPNICARDIRTDTNQIDCFCVNKSYIPYGVLKMMGTHFYVECKNEKHTPKGDYMSKLQSIINVANAGNQSNVIFSMIVSIEKGPKNFTSLSNKYYLMSKVVIIALTLADLRETAKKKANFLEMIQRKITEVEINSITDLIDAKLFGF